MWKENQEKCFSCISIEYQALKIAVRTDDLSRIHMFHFETYTPRRHGRSSLRLSSESDLGQNLSAATDSIEDARDQLRDQTFQLV